MKLQALAGGKVNQGNVICFNAFCNEEQLFLCDFSSGKPKAQHTGIAASLGIAAEAAGKFFVLGNIDVFLIELFRHFMEFFQVSPKFFNILLGHSLSGVQQGEYFDTLPYAKAAAEYLLGFIHKVKLPRKLKVAFSNSGENITHVTFRDLGFAATERGTFDVYSAGGLGREPKMGVMTASDIEPAKILYYIKAMIDTFTAYGNYENRAKSRTR